MSQSQWVFWASAAALTVFVVSAASFLAFYGSTILERFLIWKDTRASRAKAKRSQPYKTRDGVDIKLRSKGFTVLDVSQAESTFGAGSW